MSDKEPAVNAIAYYRVSTARQEESGLSLEGQQKEIHRLCAEKGWHLYDEFVDVESGKGSRTKFRKQVHAALDMVKQLDPDRKKKAVLVVYKLDRLGRNAHFLTGLRESGVWLYAMDMPNAGRLEFNIRAAFAEEEVEEISRRTKFALKVARERGQLQGTRNPKVYAGVIKRQNQAQEWCESLRPILTRYLTLDMKINDIVEALNESGVPARNGGRWNSRKQLYRVLNTLDLKKRDFKKANVDYALGDEHR